MSHGYDVGEAGLELHDPETLPTGNATVALLDRALKTVNRLVMVRCGPRIRGAGLPRE